jgi:hypothetical protein
MRKIAVLSRAAERSRRTRPTRAVDDPQADEDQQVQHIKCRTDAVDSPASELGKLWMTYAQHCRLAATTQDASGDTFGALLNRTRAEVRQAAAELLSAFPDPEQAAAEMHRRATTLWQLDLPLIGFDAAAVTYTKARIWQDCARTVNPTLPVVQARLEWS